VRDANALLVFLDLLANPLLVSAADNCVSQSWRERKRGREKQRDRERQRDTERHRETQRDTERHTDREIARVFLTHIQGSRKNLTATKAARSPEKAIQKLIHHGSMPLRNRSLPYCVRESERDTDRESG
jgi:hypothetical protein